MFKIGEFSKLTQVSIRMLRYYDETGLLKPAHIDPFTGYRFYAAHQIPHLSKIVFLRDLGFGVTEIREALPCLDEESMMGLLDAKRSHIEQAIDAERTKLLKIEQAQKDIVKQQVSMDYEVLIKSIPATWVLSLRRIVADYYQEGLLWKEMATFLEEGIPPIPDDTFTIYHDTDYRETDLDIEICLPIKRGTIASDVIVQSGVEGLSLRETEAVPLMACTMVYGPFERIAGVFYAFAAWLEEHNRYEMQGQSRQIVHRGPWNEEDPEKYVIEIQIPLIER